jgi:peptidyl-prolyl cis-trans isomerase SurA
VSEPILTPYGWHIIKRNDLKGVPAFNEIKTELKNRVGRDSRSQMGRVALIERVKKESLFKENTKNRDELLKIFDSTYLRATWKAESAAKFGNKEVFNLGAKSYGQTDFAKFLESQMSYRPGQANLQDLFRSIYKSWVDETVVAYEDSQLENKYKDFANLYREYRDGILLFDLTDQKVWSKAVRDTAGLREFYEKNKNNYMWDERAEVTNYKCLNEKVAKDLRKMLKDGKDEKQITDALNKSSQLNVSVENITYLKGENKRLDANWKVTIFDNLIDEKEKTVQVTQITKILPRTPKTLGESRGNVTAEYQNYLDAEWLAFLKKKYEVKVNEEVLTTIK